MDPGSESGPIAKFEDSPRAHKQRFVSIRGGQALSQVGRPRSIDNVIAFLVLPGFLHHFHIYLPPCLRHSNSDRCALDLKKASEIALVAPEVSLPLQNVPLEKILQLAHGLSPDRRAPVYSFDGITVHLPHFVLRKALADAASHNRPLVYFKSRRHVNHPRFRRAPKLLLKCLRRPFRIVHGLVAPRELTFKKHHVGREGKSTSRPQVMDDPRPGAVEVSLTHGRRPGRIFPRNHVTVRKVGSRPIATEHIVWSPIELSNQPAEPLLNRLWRGMKGVVQIDAGLPTVRYRQERIVSVRHHDSASHSVPEL